MDSISTEWQKNSPSSNTNRSNHSRIGQEKDEEMICIVLRDEDNNEEKKVQIGYSTTLKSLFIDYAEARDSSPRSLRFSYKGRALFLSSAKNKTPEQMGTKDRDIITVIDLTRRSKKLEFSAAAAHSSNDSNSKHSSSQSTKRKKSKAKKKKKAHAQPAQLRVMDKTQEELKIEVRTVMRIVFNYLLEGLTNHTLSPLLFSSLAFQYTHQNSRRGTAAVQENSSTPQQPVN